MDINNTLIIEWGRLKGYNNQWKAFNITLACNIFLITCNFRDNCDNEYGLYTRNYTNTSFEICSRGVQGNNAGSSYSVGYMLIGYI